MIAANKIQTDAEPAFAGQAGLRAGVSDDHRRGRCNGAMRLMGLPAVHLRSR